MTHENTPQTLPFANGKTFDTLDEYLNHMARNGHIGLPYYVEVKPGLYAYVTTMTKADAPDGKGMPLYTRDALLKRFGFSE